MKNVYIRSNNSIAKMSLIYFISLLPLIAYGFYKNGIFLYLKGYTNLIGLFKPLFMTASGGLIGAIVNVIYEKLISKKESGIKEALFSSFHITYGLLIASLISINVNIFLFIIITFVLLLTSKFIKNKNINIVALTSLIIILLSYLFSKYTYLNAYEQNTILKLNAVDYLFGRGSGGINTTCVALIILSLLLLWTSNIYKRDIPIYSFITFLLLIVGYCIYKNNIANIFSILFTNGTLFAFTFVATDPLSSSYTKNGKIIYSMLIGLLTFIFYLINPSLAVLGAILISSILASVIDLKFE